MDEFQRYLWVVAGIILSTLIPWAMTVILPPAKAEGVLDDAKSWLRYVSEQYGKRLLASLVLGLLVFAIARAANAPLETWYNCLLAGYVWDSTVEKFQRTSV